jgi:hypothetical protein
MNKFSRRFAAVLVTGALVVAGATLTASAANADSITGNIKLFTTGSNVGTIAAKQVTGGSSTTNPMIYGITVDQACPAGFRGAAIFTVFQGGVKVGTLGSTGFAADDGVEGTNGLSPADTSIAMDESSTLPAQNPKVDNNKSLEVAAPTLATGSFELRYYCGADSLGQFDFVNDKYFVLTLNFDKTAHTWSTPVAKINTTTSITASADQVAKTATINTQIKNAADGTNAATATGTATVNQTAPSAATLGTATVAAGVATFTTGSLSPGVYTFTVTYAGDTAFNGSTSSTATISINGSNTAATNITFDVLAGANPGGLVLSNVPTSVDLGSATYNGGLLTASNPTGFSGITVTDNRSLDAAAWSLTGSVSDFTAGATTLSGKYLGWTPSLTSGPTGAAAGATVLPAVQAAPTGGLKAVSQLASAPVVDGSPVTVVKAGLNVAIPANSATGHYSALLTLTLA